MVIDSHTHAWGPDNDEHPWVTESIVQAVKQLPVATEYTAEKLLDDMDEVGIDEAFVVGLPVTEWTDNWYIKKIAREYNRLYGIALVDPFATNAATTLRELMSIDDLIGFRLATVYPRNKMYEVDPKTSVQSNWLVDAIDETAFWEACLDTNAVVTFLSHVSQLEQIHSLIEAYPNLTYVIDHFGRAGGEISIDDPRFTKFGELAEYENVLVKASAIPALSEEEYPYLDMEPKIKWLLDQFGRKQVAWGSDYQFISSVTDYESTLTCLDHMDDLSTKDRRWLTERSFKQHVGIE